MTKIASNMSRGAEWLRWEPHIHAPGTVLADNFPKTDAIDIYLTALEAINPPFRAIGITDYCVTASYEIIRAEKDKGRLPQCDLLFPNIELRMNTGTVKGNFVNIHLLVDPSDPNHLDELNRFLSRLTFKAFDDQFSCTPSELIRLGRRSDKSKTTEKDALAHGCTQFKVSRENLLAVYNEIEWAQKNILIAVAGNADGTSGVRDAADTTIREEIEKAAHAIFASSSKQRDFWLGYGVASREEIEERYDSLKPCIWGCDAHDLARVGKPDNDRFCWIKGAPTFDSLRQASIEPERAYVGDAPPTWAMESQIIDELSIENADWAKTPLIRLNSGLVTIIGARGSGKTALADIIATACDSYTDPNTKPSFLSRAREYLENSTVSMRWKDGESVDNCSLYDPVNYSPEAYPRARYLSQQFVEELCSVEGMPGLIREIKRVIFEAHPAVDRDAAVDFDELLELRAGIYREARGREEEALANISEQIGIELDKSREVDKLKAEITKSEQRLARHRSDRAKLLPKKPKSSSDINKEGPEDRLEKLIIAAETVRGYLRHFANRKASLADLRNEVQDLRQNRAPEALRNLKGKYQKSRLVDEDWDEFLIDHIGDVDKIVSDKSVDAENKASNWKGEPPTSPVQEDGAFIRESDDPTKLPLAILEAEIARLEGVVAADRDTAKKISALSKHIAEETSILEKLKENLVDCEGAKARATALVGDREKAYIRVFEAIDNEERVLSDLYAPLMDRLSAAGGTLSKLSFSVSRTVDVTQWAKRGEDDLFDLRTGPFRGIGSLAREAQEVLAGAWKAGSPAEVASAMGEFREKYQDALLEKAPYKRTDKLNYRPWTRRFARWLYSTDHIGIEYGIRYDGVDIQKLSPGTRGIVLILLYLALDDQDDRPLIIDQPEENLDPKSIYDELVPLFVEAKRRRQIIMVTHNANLVINTDADQIIYANVGMHPEGGLPSITYSSGGLDEARIRQIACEVLEGGERAFRDRAHRLRIQLRRPV